MRIRHTALIAVLGLALVGAAACAPPEPARAAVVQADSVQAPLAHLVADSVSSVIALAPAHQHAPAQKIPLAPLMAFAAVGATKRRTSRRAKGVKIPDVPLYLDSDVHVMRDGEMLTIRGAQLVDDTDLEDEEIEELKQHKVVRPATASELAGLEQEATKSEAEELALKHEQDRLALISSHEQEVADAQAAGKSEAQVATLRERQAAKLATLDAQQAKEKAKQQEAGA